MAGLVVHVRGSERKDLTKKVQCMVRAVLAMLTCRVFAHIYCVGVSEGHIEALVCYQEDPLIYDETTNKVKSG